MARKDVLTHHGKYLYRREDFLGICQGDDCAAQILDLMEFWTGCKIEESKRIKAYNESATRFKQPLLQDPGLWLYERIEDFQAGVLGSFGRSSIIQRLKKLKDWRFVEDKANPNPFDKTKMYSLNIPAVQAALDEWWQSQRNREIAETHAKSESPEVTLESPEVTLESPEVTLERLEVTLERLDLDSDPYSGISQKLSSQGEGSQVKPETPLTPQGEPELCVVSEPPLAVRKEETQQPTVEPITPKVSSAFLPSEKIVPAKSAAPVRWKETSKLGKRGFPVVEGIGRSLELYPWMECDGSSRGWRYKPEFETYVAKSLVRQKYFADMKPGEFIAAVRDWLGKALMDDSRFDQVMVRWEAFQQPMTSEPNESVGKLWKQYEWEAGAAEREEYQRQSAERMAEEAARNPKPPRKQLTIKDAL